MNADRLIHSLERFKTTLPVLVDGISDDDARWKPPSGNWSILEIVCHLADEEREEFRTRIELTLQDPQQPWPPIDPEQAAVDRNYNESNLREAVRQFVSERRRSIEFLRSLKDADWSKVHVHPKFGPIQAGEVMAAWAAHDHLHVRQIAKRMFEMNQRDAAPYGTRYAGSWTA